MSHTPGDEELSDKVVKQQFELAEYEQTIAELCQALAILHHTCLSEGWPKRSSHITPMDTASAAIKKARGEA